MTPSSMRPSTGSGAYSAATCPRRGSCATSLRGAGALEAKDAERQSRRRGFAERIASDSPPWDPEVLERVEDRSA